MMEAGNVLVLDDPTNHLDLESITALNNSLRDYNGTLLFYLARFAVHRNRGQPHHRADPRRHH